MEVECDKNSLLLDSKIGDCIILVVKDGDEYKVRHEYIECCSFLPLGENGVHVDVKFKSGLYLTDECVVDLLNPKSDFSEIAENVIERINREFMTPQRLIDFLSKINIEGKPFFLKKNFYKGVIHDFHLEMETMVDCSRRKFHIEANPNKLTLVIREVSINNDYLENGCCLRFNDFLKKDETEIVRCFCLPKGLIELRNE